MKRIVPFSYEEAVEKITSTLKDQGFGILTEIDVKATLKKKIDQDFTKYVILGACNPALAFGALSEEIDIGLLLPCNIIVYENPENGETVVSIVDPEMMVQATGRTDLDDFAKSVQEKLQTALNAL
ncbi:MAG: DUF302 domain-containing protein [SAR324 cluster bacterium]|nr:DUF302 domain-containing protein [SAR324 cluster bacterium]MBL7035536.1 DUF302 domain-containing protein [SAR324 cluster bacterium]